MRKYIQKYERQLILLGVMIVIGVIVSFITPNFFSIDNITGILYGNAIKGIMAIGMMVIIATGNIDISVGAQFAVCSIVCGILAKSTGGNLSVLYVLVAVLVGIAIGLLNGILVSKLSIPSIVVTLGTMNIMRGSVYYITGGMWVDSLSGAFVKIAGKKLLGIQEVIWVWILIIAITCFILYKTRTGREVLAFGGNAEAANRVGISRTLINLVAFGYMGALTGLAGAYSAAKLKLAQPASGIGYEMDLIAAVVIGGTEFSGGIVSVSGTVLGILLMGVIENALVLAKIPVSWQDLVAGLIIIFAVASDAIKTIAAKKRKEAAR